MMGRRWSGTVHSFWSPSRRSALWAVVRFLCGGGAGFSSVELMWGGGGLVDGAERLAGMSGGFGRWLLERENRLQGERGRQFVLMGIP